MREVRDPKQALALRDAMKMDNIDTDFHFGYALAYFPTDPEREAAEILFQIHHPVFGRSQNFRRLTVPIMHMFGVLRRRGFNIEQIGIIRERLLKLPTPVADSIIPHVIDNQHLTLETILGFINLALDICGTSLSEPEAKPN